MTRATERRWPERALAGDRSSMSLRIVAGLVEPDAGPPTVPFDAASRVWPAKTARGVQ
jgi:hypothetical protein